MGSSQSRELTRSQQDFLDTPTAKALRAVYDQRGENFFEDLMRNIVMNREYCRIYSINRTDEEEGFISTSFSTPIYYSGEPYYCPNGWRRWSVDLGLTGEKFETLYGEWPVAYHGTHPSSSLKIFKHGFKRSEKCHCHLKPKEYGIYFSPSIEYAAHPRYADIYQAQGYFIQTVLQVRIKPSLITCKGHGTIPGTYPKDEQIDPNFSNYALEWVVKWNSTSNLTIADGIVVYSFMMRILKEHPGHLPQNKWWQASRPKYWDYMTTDNYKSTKNYKTTDNNKSVD